MRKIAAAVIALAVMVGCLVCVPSPAAPVTPGQQTAVTQVEPPGAPNTLQTAFCQTSTGAAAAQTITVAALAGKQIYVTGFEVTGTGATGAVNVVITIAFGGTTVANYDMEVVAGATTNQPNLIVEFTHPLVAPTPGTSCVFTVPTFGAGNTQASATIHGFYE
jgi:hypothetical protein